MKSDKEYVFDDGIDQAVLDRGVIFLCDDICSKSAEYVIKRMRYLLYNDHKEIYLYIHTNGGEIEAANSIMDEIEGYQRRGIAVNTIAIGKAYSSGAFILSTGTNRYATKSSIIMLHPVSYNLDCDYNDQNKRLADFIDTLYREIASKVAKNCGRESKRKIEEFIGEIKDGLWLTAKQAISYGIIDDVWDYNWEISTDEQQTYNE